MSKRVYDRVMEWKRQDDPIAIAFDRFKHLDPCFRNIDDNFGPFHKAARDIWLVVCDHMEANYKEKP